MTGDDEATRQFGVYVHIPFCAHRCGYCDFATWTDRDHLVERYVHACRTDLERRRGTYPAATSVFFGGGTPSLLPADDLVAIVGAIDRTADAEVTVECNPDSVSSDDLARYVDGGVNRISLGAQSFSPHVLAALDRTHLVENVARVVGAATAAGITRINIDLIYGTPGESDADWESTLASALALGVRHISAYALTIEPGTPLGRAVAAGARPATDDDQQADRYLAAERVLGAAGLENYEISNWAAPGEACRHNVLYWSMGEYLAIGCAGHGHTGGERWWNVRTPERYIAAVESGTSAIAGSEQLDDVARAEERFSLALRTSSGVAVSQQTTTETLDELAGAGLVEAVPGSRSRLRLTVTGRLLAADVTARLLVAGAAIAEVGVLALDTIECQRLRSPDSHRSDRGPDG